MRPTLPRQTSRSTSNALIHRWVPTNRLKRALIVLLAVVAVAVPVWMVSAAATNVWRKPRTSASPLISHSNTTGNLNSAFTASVIYVDDSWAGTTLGEDPDGAGPATNFGVESFATIQEGVDAVAAGGTVNVAAGTYTENVIISKALTLTGAGEANVFLRPALSGPNPCPTTPWDVLCTGTSNMILVQANDVTISGLTLDGDNPWLTSNEVRGGADLDARNGILTNRNAGTFNNLTVHHTTVKNIYLRGIFNNASSSVSFNFHDNTVQNVRGDYYSIAMFNRFGTGVFANNNVSDANDAISSNWSGGVQFLNNTVTNSDSGIHTDNAGGAGGIADTISGNTITNSSSNPTGYGIWVFVPYKQVTVQNNTVTNVDVGMATFGMTAGITTSLSSNAVSGVSSAAKRQLPRSVNVSEPDSVFPVQSAKTAKVDPSFDSSLASAAVFTGNTIDGQNKANSTGVWFSTDQLGFGSASSRVTFNNNTVINNTDGFFLEVTDTATLDLNVAFNRIVNNSNSGVTVSNVSGTLNADMENNWWGCNAGPNSTGCGSVVGSAVDFNPWFKAAAQAVPNSIMPGATSNVSVDLTHNSDNAVPASTSPDTPVSYAATSGTMTPATGTITAGVASSQFTSTSNNSAVVTVTVDNENFNLPITVAAPVFSINDVTQVEGNPPGTTAYVFTVTKTGATPFGSSVQFQTVDGTATAADNDYVSQSGTLNFGPSDTTMQVTVQVNHDFKPESDEAFTVHLFGEVGATISDADGTGAIQNDDDQPNLVYVDDDFTQPIGSDPDGAGPATAIGYDAFKTIQEGIDTVSSGGTVIVYAGTYAEQLSVNKPLSVLGPNATINPNTGSRVPEATIIPTSSDPLNAAFEGPIAVYLQVAGITFKGFTVDGDNPSLTSGVVFNGADVNAEFGIYGDGAADLNAVVENNIVQNVGEVGIWLNTFGLGGPRNGNTHINQNKIDNLLGVYGQGIRISDGCWADVTNNVVTRVRNGIVIENYSGNVTTHPASIIDHNEVTSFRIGIRHNLHYVYGGPGFTISNNTVQPYVQSPMPPQVTTPTAYQGIRVESIQQTVAVTVQDNVLIGNKTAMQAGGYTRNEGFYVTNASTTSPNIHFDHNDVRDFLRGAFHETPALPDFECNLFYGNTTAIEIDAAASNGLIAHQNNIFGNSAGVKNNSSAVVNATNNYWGRPTGPTASGNPGGTGDTVSTNVTFSPFLTAYASCAPVFSFTVTASAGANGSISPTSPVSVEYGESQTFNITPDPHYHVTDVLVDGASVGAVTSYTFTDVRANHTISATFAITTHTITATAGANGSITPAGTVIVNDGADQPFNITPNSGYHVQDVLVDSVSVGPVTSQTLTNVTADHTISATFALTCGSNNNVYVDASWVGTTIGADPDGAGPATIFGCDSFATIQEGVNAVAASGTVVVHAGNYTEQLTISKSLTLAGENTATTVLHAPATLNPRIGGHLVLVQVDSSAQVNMSGITIAGPRVASGCSAAVFYGIFVVGGANLNLHDAAVTNIRLSSDSLLGCQDGISMRVGSQALGQIGTVTVDNVSFTGYQKAAIVVDNTGSTGTITNNTIIGLGPENIAANAVQISRGAAATITDNNITANQCTASVCGPDPLTQTTSTGVLVYQTNGLVSISNNTISNNDTGIYNNGTATTITGNTMVANRFNGIFQAQGSSTITGNTLTGLMNVGIAAVSLNGATGNSTATLTGNTILGATTGLQLLDQTNVDAFESQLTAHFNRIVSTTNSIGNLSSVSGLNGVSQSSLNSETGSASSAHAAIVKAADEIDGILVERKSTSVAAANIAPNSVLPLTSNLENNWWGCNAGPGNPGCGAASGSNVDFSPWLVVAAQAVPNPITPSATSNVSVDLTHNSDNGVPASTSPNTPVSYSATNGSMTPATGTITAGVASSLFTSTSSNSAVVTVTVDNETLNLPITVAEPPSFSIDDVTHVEGNGGTTAYVFTITKTGSTTLNASVNFQTADVSATVAGNDYQSQTGSLTFLPVETTKTVTVLVNGDTTVEPNETFSLNLSGATNATINDSQGIGTITNDDTNVSLAVSPSTALEDGATNLVYTFTRNGNTTGALTANFTVAGAASFNSDYTQSGAATFSTTNGTVTFAAGNSTATVTIDPTADSVVEPDETVILTLASGSDYGIGSPGAATGTITNVDSDVSVAVSPSTVLEDGATNLVYTFTRNGNTTGALTVNFSVAGSAAFGTDYTPSGAAVFTATTGSVTFAAGSSTATVTVDPTTDVTVEPDVTVILTVVSGAGYNVGSPSAATGTITNDDVNTLQFSSASFNTTEGSFFTIITVERSGDTSGAVSVDYTTPDDSAATSVVPCETVTGVASPRCDFTTAVGTLRWASGDNAPKSFIVLISEDNYIEGAEELTLTLSNPTGGAQLGSRSTTILTIDDDVTEQTQNPIDGPSNYVRQHYHDFLNREPDQSGFNFWVGNFPPCGSDPGCIEVKRINVSAAFYLSIEFQGTGYFVERLYKSSYGDATGTSVIGGPHQLAVPVVKFSEFLPDTQEIGRGVVVLAPGWEEALEANKVAFTDQFVQRARFLNAYPLSMTPAQFVDALNANAGNPLSTAERDQLVNDLTSGAKNRAQVLRAVAEDQDLINAEFNRGFVLMQYFGFLRRNPDAAPDNDHSGYDFWLKKLDEFNGNYVAAEMVKAFLTSSEYRKRAGAN